MDHLDPTQEIGDEAITLPPAHRARAGTTTTVTKPTITQQVRAPHAKRAT